jgi:hypothetical protein
MIAQTYSHQYPITTPIQLRLGLPFLLDTGRYQLRGYVQVSRGRAEEKEKRTQRPEDRKKFLLHLWPFGY